MSTLKQRPQSRSTSAQPAAAKMRGGSSAAGSPAVTDVRATGLLNYKYASINKSILCNSFMGTFWDWIATVMPTWVSPNMVTAFGAVCSWLVLPLVHYCRSSLSESVTKDGITVHSIDEKSMPTFQAVYGVALVCLWLYNTLDNVDGKLARQVCFPKAHVARFTALSAGMCQFLPAARVNCSPFVYNLLRCMSQRKLSSPLGQWFDHGCDAYTVASLISSLGWMLDLKLGWALVLWSGLLATWIVVNWEEHLLHRMRFDARTALRVSSMQCHRTKPRAVRAYVYAPKCTSSPAAPRVAVFQRRRVGIHGIGSGNVHDYLRPRVLAPSIVAEDLGSTRR